MDRNSMRLLRAEMEIQQLKTRLAYLLSRPSGGDTEIAEPTVDFAADFFDRSNADTLGSYWGNGSGARYVIRSNRAVQRGSLPTGFATQLDFSHVTAGPPFQPSVASTLFATTAAELAYGVTLSSSNLTCKITFDGPPAGISSGTVVPQYTAPLATSGVSLGGAAARILSFNYPAESVTPAEITLGATFSTIPTELNILLGVGSVLHNVGAPPGALLLPSPVAGSNTLSMSFDSTGSGQLSINLNGTVFYTGASLLLSTPTQAGISSPFSDVLGDAVRLGVSPTGITSFKVWRSDIPEPPSQSGHGTFAKGVFQYIDKYHTPTPGGGFTYSPNV